MKFRILTSELLGDFGMFSSQLEVGIEAFRFYLVTTTYGDNFSDSGST